MAQQPTGSGCMDTSEPPCEGGADPAYAMAAASLWRVLGCAQIGRRRCRRHSVREGQEKKASGLKPKREKPRSRRHNRGMQAPAPRTPVWRSSRRTDRCPATPLQPALNFFVHYAERPQPGRTPAPRPPWPSPAALVSRRFAAPWAAPRPAPWAARRVPSRRTGARGRRAAGATGSSSRARATAACWSAPAASSTRACRQCSVYVLSPPSRAARRRSARGRRACGSTCASRAGRRAAA